MHFEASDKEKIIKAWRPTGTFYLTKAELAEIEESEMEAERKRREALEKKLKEAQDDNVEKDRLIKQSEEDRR